MTRVMFPPADTLSPVKETCPMHQRPLRTCLLFACGILSAAAALPALAAPGAEGDVRGGNAALLTVAEASDFHATAHHADVVTLLDRLCTAYPNLARRSSMGETTEHREIPLLIASDPPVATAAEARALAAREGRAIVLLFGNIHAGEVCGKEALCILAREMLGEAELAKGGDGPTGVDGKGASAPPLLRRAIVVFAPIYNADGNDRFGPLQQNRGAQVGPADGVGIRHNAMDLDLNRDFLKLEAPETRALVRFMNEWDPNIIVDTHTTNGSRHRHVITYAGPKTPAGDAGVIEYSRQVFLPWIEKRFEDTSGMDATWYGSFGGVFGDKPRSSTQWETFPAEARFGTSYIGLRGRLGILSEAYAYATFKERVEGTRLFCRAIVEYAAERGPELRELARLADERTSASKGPVVLRTEAVAQPFPVTIKTFAKWDGHEPENASDVREDRVCSLMDRFETRLEVPRPLAYAIRADMGEVSKIVENLRLHGLRIETLSGPVKVKAEVYTIDAAKPASREFQKHVLITAEATPAPKDLTLPAGTLIVRTKQPLGNLACYLLEPECEDGLTTWNFFDAWMKPGAEFPVVRVMSGL